MHFDDKKEIFKTKYNLIVDILTSVASLYQDPTNFIVLTFVNHCKARYEPFLYLYKKRLSAGSLILHSTLFSSLVIDRE